MLVRPRSEEDLPVLAEVLRRVHAESGYPVQGLEDPIRFLSADAIVKAWTLTNDDGEVVGQCVVSEIDAGDERLRKWEEHMWKTTGEGYERPLRSGFLALGRLFIDPSMHGQGAGEKLVQQAFDWTAGVLMRRLILNVLLKDPPAIALYQKLGWTQYGDGTFTNGKGEKFKQVYFISPKPRRTSSAASQTVALTGHGDEYEQIRHDAQAKVAQPGYLISPPPASSGHPV